MPANKPTPPNSRQQLQTGTLLDADPAKVSRHLSDLATALTAMDKRLDVFKATTQGFVPAPGFGKATGTTFLRDDGVWQSIAGASLFDATHDGIVPASGGGTTNYLRADGTWQNPGAGSVPTARLINTTAPLTGGGDLSADRTLAVSTFGAGASGVVPASGGGSTNYLRADGTWAAPPGLGVTTDVSLTGDGVTTTLKVNGPYVDLRQAPYNVVAGSTAAATTNANGIRAAIAAYTGTHARLVLPQGIVYVARDTVGGNASIKLSGVTDLSLEGQGMMATRIVQYDAGGFVGDWHGIYIDNSQRIQLRNFGIQQGSDIGADAQQHHLIYLISSVGSTQDVNCDSLFFGQGGTNCDGFRLFGSTSTVTNVSLRDFVMKLDGIGAGSRSGVAIQRGYQNVEIGNGFIRGAKNSPIDMEPTGSATMDTIYFHDLVIDNSLGSSSVAVSFGGVSNGALAMNIRARDITVIAGRVTVNSTSSCDITRLTAVISAPYVTGETVGPLQIFQVNDGLILRDCHLEVTSTANMSTCLDLQNRGDSTLIDGGYFNYSPSATTGRPVTAQDTDGLRIRGLRCIYGGTGAASQAAVYLSAINTNCNNVNIHGLDVTTTVGTLRSAVDLEPRTPNQMTPIRISGVNCHGTCTYGVYLSYGAGSTMDVRPALHDVQSYVTALFKQVDQGNNPITSIFPCIAGSPSDVADYVGEASPEGALIAIPGSICVYKNGDSTLRYVKSSGTGSAGWQLTTTTAGATDPGSQHLQTGQYLLQYKQLSLTGVEQFSLSGTAEVFVTDLHTYARAAQETSVGETLIGSPYAPSSNITLPSGCFFVQAFQLSLTGEKQLSLQGTADFIIADMLPMDGQLSLRGVGS